MDTITIPPGYRQDAQGRLIPEAIIPARQLAADDLVRELLADVRFARDFNSALKARLLDRVRQYVIDMALDYGAVVDGRAGGVTLQNYAGTGKLERASADRVRVGPEILAAEELVRVYLDEETSGASEAVRALVNRAFRRNPKTGGLNVGRLLDLIAVEIDDERWRDAQRAVREALVHDESVVYFRAYERNNPTEPWRQIPLDFSALEPVPGVELLASIPSAKAEDHLEEILP